MLGLKLKVVQRTELKLTSRLDLRILMNGGNEAEKIKESQLTEC